DPIGCHSEYGSKTGMPGIHVTCTATGGRTVKTAAASDDESSARTCAVGAIERDQGGQDSVGCKPDHRTIIAANPGTRGSTIEIAIRTQSQPFRKSRQIGPGIGSQSGEGSIHCDFEHHCSSLRNALSLFAHSCPVEIV